MLNIRGKHTGSNFFFLREGGGPGLLNSTASSLSSPSAPRLATDDARRLLLIVSHGRHFYSKIFQNKILIKCHFY